jgi:hypothetical protein
MARQVGKSAAAKREAAIGKISASAISSKPKSVTKAASPKPIPSVKKRHTKREPTAPLSPEVTPAAPATTSAVKETDLQLRPSKLPQLLSPYRFPMAIDRGMSRLARTSGVAFVVLGALFTLNNVSMLLGSDPVSSVVESPSQVATLITGTDGEEIDPTATQLRSTISIDAQTPLTGTVEVTITTPSANRIEIFMFTESWQTQESIGVATQVAPDRWVFSWDTTALVNNQDYRLSASVWNRTRYTIGSDPDYKLQLDYLQVDNSSSASPTTPMTGTGSTVDETPAATLYAPATLTGASNVTVSVANATSLWLMVEHQETGSRNNLYNATRVAPTEWRVNWPTAGYQDGRYTVRARVQNSYGTYTDGELVVTLDNFDENADDSEVHTADESTDSAEADAAPVTADKPGVASPTPLPVLPTLTLSLDGGTSLTGTERLEAVMSSDVASHVYFYLREPLSTIPRFVGAGVKTPGSNRWYVNWYTPNTPNGTYTLFARAVTPPGPIDSQDIAVRVQNEVVLKETAADVTEVARITTVSQAFTEEVGTIKEPTTSLVPAPADPEGGIAATTTIPTLTAANVLQGAREAFDAELIRLGSAYRLKDEAAMARIRTRIAKLVAGLLAGLEAAERSRLEAELQTLVENTIAKYLSEIERVGTLIAERQQSDVLKDTDQDGIADFDEVTLYNTNPLVADTDNDGFTDGAEILSGYDPLSDVRESVIAYESPKDTGVFRDDVLKIDTVTRAPIGTETPDVSTPILLTGRALPNSFATLYIFSTPVVVTVKTDAEGAFAYRFDQELEDGQHNVYVGITDNAGRIVAKSQPFGFIKEAQAITPNQAAIVDNSAAAENQDSLITGYAFAAIVSISVVAIGLVLILLGLQLESRRKKAVSPDALVMPTV